jgi:DNA-directed RNA polymerase specialized sigma24 family protein
LARVSSGRTGKKPASVALPLKLHDVDDTARFVGSIVSRCGLSLNEHDRNDLHAYLYSEAWRLSRRYRPGGITFSDWARITLRRRVIDWQRQRNDHRYQRPQLVAFDDSDPGQLECALGAGRGDLAPGWGPDLERLLATSDRQRARDLRTLGLAPPGGAA